MPYTYAGLYAQAVLNDEGNLMPGRLVSVKLPDSTTLATLFTSRAKTTTLTNPPTIAGSGVLSFYADPGEYDLRVITDGVEGPALRIEVPADAEEDTPEILALQSQIADLPTSAAQLPFSNPAFAATNTESAIVEASAGTAISDLTAATALNDADLLVITQGGVTKNIPAGQLRALLTGSPLGPTGALAETIPRIGGGFNASLTTGLATGTLRLGAIKLYQGQVINSISFLSGATAAAGSSHLWFGLYDANRNKLAVTADDTSATPWGTNTVKTMALTAPYTIPSTGLYYLAQLIVATTVPTMQGVANGSIINNLAPILAGNTTDTGLTTPSTAPATAGAITASGNRAYGYVS